jgi:hypothetical protein
VFSDGLKLDSHWMINKHYILLQVASLAICLDLYVKNWSEFAKGRDLLNKNDETDAICNKVSLIKNEKLKKTVLDCLPGYFSRLCKCKFKVYVRRFIKADLALFTYLDTLIFDI